MDEGLEVYYERGEADLSRQRRRQRAVDAVHAAAACKGKERG